MLTNSLYALNKYLWLKEGNAEDGEGRIKYTAWEAQEVILYLYDLGCNLMIAKARQIGFSATIGGAAAVRTMLTKSYFTKFIAQDDSKTKEIFSDKIKFAVQNFDRHVVPTVDRDSGTQLRFAKSNKKGTIEGKNSNILVDKPKEDAINGGQPNLVLLDEAAFHDLLGAILRQGRPAMYWVNPKTNKFELKRQVLAWTTGGNMEKGGAVFQDEILSAIEAFDRKDYRQGFIPIFINVFARPGFTQQDYETEQRYYYSKRKELGKVDPRVEFHQSFAVTLDDVFLLSSDTIIPTMEIDKHLSRCKPSGIKKIGMFIPVYDTTRPLGERYGIPFSIADVKFVPASNTEIVNDGATACVRIFHDVEEGEDWDYRYFQGTDPIFSSSGFSNFSSSIYDKVEKRKCASINFRHQDYRFCYIQAICLGLYYSRLNKGKRSGVKHLIEQNVGGELINMIKDLKLTNTLVYNNQLPEVLQSGSSEEYGLRKHSSNANFLIARIEEMLQIAKDGITDFDFWFQMKTYVKKVTQSGKSYTYEPQNSKYHRDDDIDSTLYSYICACCFDRFSPRKYTKELENKLKKRKGGLVLNSDYTIGHSKSMVRFR
jgi:hypothetical protein